MSAFNLATLRELLTKHGIPVDDWGMGEAKTLTHLLKEIEEGETVLVEDELGLLYRLIQGVGVLVEYTAPTGQRFVLKEDRQVFADGRERRRQLGDSVGEKCKRNEDPTEAAARAVREELGCQTPVLLEQLETEQMEKVSQSYPGLLTQYRVCHFRAVLTTEQFNLDGYVETQEDLTTYFVWKLKK